MNGIELAENFYLDYGKAMLEEKFPHLLQHISVGICGSGSDCFGFDDAVSRDHDYEAGFIVFLPGEDVVSRRDEFLLERAYSALPKEYEGVKRNTINPVGGNRKGIVRISDFFMEKTGTTDGNLSTKQWLSIPEFYLAEAVNGKVFFDGDGRLSSIRNALKNMPGNVRLKKLAGGLMTMAQSGLYNYPRCILHGESGAAQLALSEFVKSALNVVFHINEEYMPYYKWAFKAYKRLPVLNGFSEMLEYLISSPNEKDHIAQKTAYMEKICSEISETVRQKYGLSEKGDLGKLAYELNDLISDISLRNESIFYAT